MSPRPAVLLLIALLAFLPGPALLGEPPASVRTDHYGDPLPKDARFRLGTVRLRHDGFDVLALAWLPDGRTLASASWDGTVRLWQIPGGKQISQWDSLQGVALSPDGRTLACGEEVYTGKDSEWVIRIVDVASGKDRRRIRAPENGGGLFNTTPGCCEGVCSPDGKILAVRAGELGVHLYSLDNGKFLRFLKTKVFDFGHPVVFTPDSRAVLVAGDDGIYRLTIHRGAKEKILEALKGQNFAYSFAFSPDSKMLAALISDDTITLRSWPAGKELRRLQIRNDGWSDMDDENMLRFSPDGKLLAFSAGGTIRLWNPATGQKVRCFEGHRGNKIHDFAFSPDGSLLATAGADSAVIVWEVHPDKAPRPLTGVGHWLELVGLAADQQTLLTRSIEGALTVWDARDGRRLRSLAKGEDSADRFLFSPEVGSIRASLRREMESDRYRLTFAKGETRCSAFSPDSTVLAAGCTEGILLLRRTAKRIESRLLKDKERAPVRAITFAPDGRTLAACFTNGSLLLWDSRTSQPRHVLSFPSHAESYRYSAFSPDGRLLALSDRHALYLIESASGQRFRELPIGEHWIDSLAFAPDNRTLALGDSSDIRLWDLPTHKQIHIFQGHQYSITKLIFSADGRFLLSGSEDNTVLSWDIAAVRHRHKPNKELSAARLTELWADLAAPDAVRGQRAVSDLIQTPKAALPFLEKSLPPVAPEKMTHIAELIADLDHEQFARRENASTELTKIGAPASPALRKTLNEKPTLEMRRRIEALLEVIDARPLSLDELRTVRALQVLETIGTAEARRVLGGLAHGAAAAQLTLEATAALQRLDRRYAKP